MIFPSDFERKIGFNIIKTKVASLCQSEMAREHVENMSFSSEFDVVNFNLSVVEEMVSLLSGEDILPLGNVTDVSAELKGVGLGGSFITPQELLSIRKALESMSDLDSFFRSLKNEEGRSRVPNLDSVASGLLTFPDCKRVIDRVLDRYGNVKDSASSELMQIRRSINSMSGAVNAAMRRVLSQALKDGIVDAETSPAIRDGRLVIPIAPMNKRRISGIVHDESASGKTVYIEPAEVVEANNRLRELQMDERREVAHHFVCMCRNTSRCR